MAASQRPTAKRSSRGLLARPLDTLVFLAPLIAFYEIASQTRQERVIAFDLLRRFIELFGPVGAWAPGLAVVIILLATHTASGEKWSVSWNRVGRMYVEAAVLAVPLLIVNWAIPLTSEPGPPTSTFDRIVMGVGAGVYEELVFRLILIPLLMMIGADLLRLDRSTVAVGAVILSSLAFASHHHQPIGMEAFDPVRLAFRTIAGGYLAVVFWYRGYGPAAGCHAAYNVVLVAIGPPNA